MAVALLCMDPTEQCISDSPGALPTQRWECGEVRIGETGRSRSLGSETPLGTTTYGGKGCKESTRVRGKRPIGAASF